jgi:hypothetical protein
MIALHRAWPFIAVAAIIALLSLPLSGCVINIEYMLDAAHNASRKAAFKFLEEARKLREAQDRSEQS